MKFKVKKSFRGMYETLTLIKRPPSGPERLLDYE